ncbi:metal ABC transporter solute-binding protein, Zn/Mn family [Oceanobacillus halotolerans]|uniref:metal ABC transporter solute-binding protein, Zn/Mn family n=1 Tax=Oceanobacillus halotolerans TaxID=2663380 RepID=UPI0013D8FD39|nr:zinc ABC transporter substrate-binding protein [Oceanobacillus halotolerans]
MKLMQAILIVIILSLTMFGCTSDNKESANDTIIIHTSVYPIQYIIERIGGNTVQVESVYPPGVDAHTYEPTSKEMTDIAKGDAFIYLGEGLEGFAETAAEALAEQDLVFIELGKFDDLFHMEENNTHKEENEHKHDAHDGHNHGDHDPHIWLDPIRMMEMASILKETLMEINPAGEATYTENHLQLQDDLEKLDEEYKQIFQTKENKNILVSHAAYGYWEKRYGLKQIAINGLSSSSEPSQKDLTKIIEQAEQYNLNYIIFEQNSSNRVSEIIQDHIDAKAMQIHNLAVLTEEDIKEGNDYLSLMYDNLAVLDQVTN